MRHLFITALALATAGCAHVQRNEAGKQTYQIMVASPGIAVLDHGVQVGDKLSNGDGCDQPFSMMVNTRQGSTQVNCGYAAPVVAGGWTVDPRYAASVNASALRAARVVGSSPALPVLSPDGATVTVPGRGVLPVVPSSSEALAECPKDRAPATVAEQSACNAQANVAIETVLKKFIK